MLLTPTTILLKFDFTLHLLAVFATPIINPFAGVASKFDQLVLGHNDYSLLNLSKKSKFTIKPDPDWLLKQNLLLWPNKRRWRSGQSQQTVNLSPFGLRGFESLPAHQNLTFIVYCATMVMA